MKRIQSEITIDASPESVYSIITDFDSYPEWNEFTPRITCTSTEFRVGTEFDLDCRMDPSTLLHNEHEAILEIRPHEHSFCMGTSRTRGRPGIRSYRWQICSPGEGGVTQFMNYEQFEGILAPIVYLLYAKKLKTAFDAFCVSLKKRAELLNPCE